eukprot:5114699-Pyramimonas_sp.AAC.1
MGQCLRKYGGIFGFQADTILAQAAAKRVELVSQIPKPMGAEPPAAGGPPGPVGTPGGAGGPAAAAA